MIFALALSNAMLLYPGMESNFVNMVFASAVTTPLYYYALIPLFTLLSLIIVNSKEMIIEVYRQAKPVNAADQS
jgi:hypothetical protein